jgi:hypothetical protein
VLKDAGDLALDLLLYSVGPDQLAPLPRFKFDGELLGAQVEIYKVAQALASKANPQGFPDALTLPAPVAPDYNPAAHKAAPIVLASTKKAPEKPVSTDTGSGDEDEDQIKLTTGQPKPKGEGEARAETKTHTLTAETTETQALATPGAEEGEKKGLGTWTIVGISVLAVAAVAVGTYFIVEAATAKPSSANLGITW